MSKRFHVEVRIRENQLDVWKPVRPTRGEPYVFTEDQAQQYLETHILTSGTPDRFRMVEVPEDVKRRLDHYSQFSDLLQ